MRNALTEKAALRKLHIKDWRGLSKEKFLKFASTIPYMDPEVAKAALEQFPNLVETAKESLNNISESISRSYEFESDSLHSLYASLDRQIDVLQSLLTENTELSFENSMEIIREINTLVEMKRDIHSEAIRHSAQKTRQAIVSSVGVVATLAVAIGGALIMKNDSDNEE